MPSSVMVPASGGGHEAAQNRHPMLERTSQLRGDRGRFLSSTIRRTDEEARLRPPRHSSQGSSARSQRVIRAELCGRRSWPTLCLLSRIRGRQQEGSAAASLRSRPSASTLQMIVAIERQFSCIFPAHPRSLASVLIPRPAALRRSAFPGLLPQPDALGPHSRKSPSATWERRQTLRPHKTQLGLGSGAPRVASRKSVPRVIRANTTKEK